MKNVLTEEQEEVLLDEKLFLEYFKIVSKSKCKEIISIWKLYKKCEDMNFLELYR